MSVDNRIGWLLVAVGVLLVVLSFFGVGEIRVK